MHRRKGMGNRTYPGMLLKKLLDVRKLEFLPKKPSQNDCICREASHKLFSKLGIIELTSGSMSPSLFYNVSNTLI